MLNRSGTYWDAVPDSFVAALHLNPFTIMNIQENTQLVQQGYALFLKGDIPNLLNTYSDEIEFVFSGNPEVNPISGTFRGKEQVRNIFAIINDNIKFETFEPREFIAQGDKVVVLGHDRGTTKVAGESFEQDWVHVLTVQNGKITRLQGFLDHSHDVRLYKGVMQEAH
ncbi:nuclear transport factor 2 family protein [Adhaeribacter radiodurans]|uniref:Nuclear transport factor 2 family protein n=1 Tax=Adhaeribacter radiodurans TaxID=2745197 RepID=A0A7L7L5G7_9BACT|nr:nuclear transport factor 2 family protein [Adhaeribacter radiodurans]QMU28051.1 nuclear transport factor 2 family protein [Adhaeribacter radiodurans]